MEQATEERFLAAAYKFLSEISLGGGPPVATLKAHPAKGSTSDSSGVPSYLPSSPTDDTPLFTAHPHRIARIRPSVLGRDWLQGATSRLASPPLGAALLVATLALPNSLHGFCRLSLKGHIPLAHRRSAKGSALRDGHLDIPTFQIDTGKARSYRHLLPRRLQRFAGWGRSETEEEESSPSTETSHSQVPSPLAPSLSPTSSSSSSSSSSATTSNDGNSSSSDGTGSEHDPLLDGEEYQSDILDDPQLRTGKHRTIITLTSFLASIDHFTKAEFLKRELNEKFRNLHPEVHPSLTLSQIRNVKARILAIATGENLEAATVARSFVYLEKLIIKTMVWKGNRCAVAGCCLLLAAKATDSKKTQYPLMLDRLAAELAVERKELLNLEFPIMAALHFRLQIPEGQFGGHLSRILSHLDYSNLQEYLGERMHDTWQQSL